MNNYKRIKDRSDSSITELTLENKILREQIEEAKHENKLLIGYINEIINGSKQVFSSS